MERGYGRYRSRIWAHTRAHAKGADKRLPVVNPTMTSAEASSDQLGGVIPMVRHYRYAVPRYR